MKNRIIAAALVITFLLGFASNISFNETQFIPIVSGGGGTNDHGELDGLGDDDHTQYILHTELDSEAELESQIVGVTNFWNNNDFADNSANWNTAYSWGDHSTQNYFDFDIHGLFNVFNQELNTSNLVQFLGCVLQDTDNTDITISSTGSESDSTLTLVNDDSSFIFECEAGTVDRFKINNNGYFPFVIEDGGTQNAMIYIDNNNMIDIKGASPNYLIELPNVASNSGGRGNANRWDTYSDKRFKEDFSGLPENYVIELCRLINWRIYKPISNWQDENGTIYKGETENEYCIAAYAQPLYWDIINTFGNNTLAHKIANQIVHKPQDENRDYWTVNYDSIFMITSRGLQIADNYIQENIQHTKHIENFLENYGYDPLPWN